MSSNAIINPSFIENLSEMYAESSDKDAAIAEIMAALEGLSQNEIDEVLAGLDAEISDIVEESEERIDELEDDIDTYEDMEDERQVEEAEDEIEDLKALVDFVEDDLKGLTDEAISIQGFFNQNIEASTVIDADASGATIEQGDVITVGITSATEDAEGEGFPEYPVTVTYVLEAGSKIVSTTMIDGQTEYQIETSEGITYTLKLVGSEANVVFANLGEIDTATFKNFSEDILKKTKNEQGVTLFEEAYGSGHEDVIKAKNESAAAVLENLNSALNGIDSAMASADIGTTSMTNSIEDAVLSIYAALTPGSDTTLESAVAEIKKNMADYESEHQAEFLAKLAQVIAANDVDNFAIVGAALASAFSDVLAIGTTDINGQYIPNDNINKHTILANMIFLLNGVPTSVGSTAELLNLTSEEQKINEAVLSAIEGMGYSIENEKALNDANIVENARNPDVELDTEILDSIKANGGQSIFDNAPTDANPDQALEYLGDAGTILTVVYALAEGLLSMGEVSADEMRSAILSSVPDIPDDIQAHVLTIFMALVKNASPELYDNLMADASFKEAYIGYCDQKPTPALLDQIK